MFHLPRHRLRKYYIKTVYCSSLAEQDLEAADYWENSGSGVEGIVRFIGVNGGATYGFINGEVSTLKIFSRIQK